MQLNMTDREQGLVTMAIHAAIRNNNESIEYWMTRSSNAGTVERAEFFRKRARRYQEENLEYQVLLNKNRALWPVGN